MTFVDTLFCFVSGSESREAPSRNLATPALTTAALQSDPGTRLSPVQVYPNGAFYLFFASILTPAHVSLRCRCTRTGRSTCSSPAGWSWCGASLSAVSSSTRRAGTVRTAGHSSITSATGSSSGTMCKIHLTVNRKQGVVLKRSMI